MNKYSKYRELLDATRNQICQAEIGVTGVFQLMMETLDTAEKEAARKDAEIEALKEESKMLREANGRLSNGLFLSTEEFMTLATFCMVNDQPEQHEDIDTQVLHCILDQIAIQQFDFTDWIAAYHGLDL